MPVSKIIFFTTIAAALAVFSATTFAGQGAQRMLYTSPNMTFVENPSGDHAVTVNDTSGSISSLQTEIASARAANPTNVIVIFLASNTTYLVSSASLTLGSNECLVASGAIIQAANSSVTVPLIQIASNSINVSVSGGMLNGNGAFIQGIFAASVSRMNVDKIIVQNCGQDCILLEGQGNSTYDNEMTVTRCDCSGSPGHAGISIQNSTQTAVIDNNCHDNAIGIYLSCAWADVANNTCENNSTGIDIAGGDDNNIANNTCNNNGTGISAGASNNMLASNSTGNNSTAGINSSGSGNTFADNLFTSGNAANFTSGGSGNHVVAYQTALSAPGQGYFYPPLINNQHTNTIINGMGRYDLTNNSTATIDSVQSQYNSAVSANRGDVIVLHLNGTYTVGSNPLILFSNTCVLLSGTIQINSSTKTGYAIAATNQSYISISGGTVDGGTTTSSGAGHSGIYFTGDSMFQIDAVTLQNFGTSGTRVGGSDVVRIDHGSTPRIVTRCTVTNGSARGIWVATSGVKDMISDNTVTGVQMDGVDCDESTSGSLVKFNYLSNNTRYGVFVEQSASQNLLIGNVCNNDASYGIGCYNNSATPRGSTEYNSIICNSIMGDNGLRNGSTGTNIVTTSHNFFFDNTVINANIESQLYGTQNYYSQNYMGNSSLSTSGTETFFNSTDVSSNLFLQDDNSGLPAQVQGGSTANGAEIVIGQSSGGGSDQWALIPTDSGYYRITNKKSGLSMNVSGASLSAGAPIIQFTFGSGKNDQWMPMSAGNGLYYFINRLSGLCLDVPNSAPGTQLDQQPYNGGANQQFNLNLIATTGVQPPFFLSASPGSQSVNIGGSTNYTITLATNSNFAPPVTFALSGLPANTGANFNPASLNNSGSTILTVTTSNDTPVGNYTLTVSGNSSAGTNTIAVALSVATPGSNLVWNSTSSTAWDTTTANWFNELTSANDVFQNGKNVLFTDAAGIVTNITIASGVSVAPASVAVNADAENYSISGAGKITGATGLNKSGNGILTLNTTNDFTGGVTISSGIVTTPNLANGGTASGIGAGSSSVVLDGGTLQWTGGASITVNRGFTLTPNGGALDASPPTQFNLTLSGTIAFSNSGERTLILTGTDPNPLSIGGNAINSVIADGSGGATAIEKDGNNAWNLTNNNTYSGGTVINSGRLRANTSVNVFGSGPVTVANGGQAYLNVGAAFPNAFSIAGIGIPETEGNFGALRLAVNSCNITNTITLMDDSRITARGANAAGAFISGQITGDANLEFGNTGSSPGIITLSNSLNNWSGDTTISHGTVKFGAVDAIPHGADVGDVTINNSNPTNNSLLDLNGISPTINGLDCSGNDFTRCIVTNSSATAATLTIGDNDANGTFGGIIKNGAGIVALTKIGAGSLTLSGANNYTGNTIVSNGELLVNGSLANSAVNVMSGGTLGGNGILNGSVTVNSGGTIAPGNSVGILTVNNSVTLQGTTFMELNKSLGTNDSIQATTIAFGGTLSLTNLSGTLTNGDSFKLFSAGSYSGAFTNIIPATPGANLAWNTNSLATGGVLKIVSTMVPTPHITSISLNGTTLTISGTNGSTGGQFVLLTSTNIAQPLNQWTPVLTNNFDGNGNFNLTTNVVNPGDIQEFYLLQSQ